MNIKRLKHIKGICVLIISTAPLIFLASCGCKECPGNVKVDTERAQKRQEQLAKQEKPYGTGTGMLFSFSATSKTEKPVTAQPGESVPYKDLSMLYVMPEDKCPFNTQSAHTSVSAGPNMSFKSAGDDTYEGGSHKPGVGFQAGVRLTYRFDEKFAVVPGLFYKQNNASEEAEFRDGGVEVPVAFSVADKYSYNYLSLPILAQYNISEAFSINAGPEVNYLLKSKVNSEMTAQGNTNENNENITKNSTKLGLGVQVGLKYQIPDSRVAVQLTYDHRLSRLNEKPDVSITESSAWRMKSLQLGVTVRTCDLFNKRDHKGVID